MESECRSEMAFTLPAYAKLHGSYEGIDAGLSRRSMIEKLGGFSKSIVSLLSPEVSCAHAMLILTLHVL